MIGIDDDPDGDRRHLHLTVPPIRNRKLATVSRELEDLLHEVNKFKAAAAKLDTAMIMATMPLTTNKIIINTTA